MNTSSLFHHSTVLELAPGGSGAYGFSYDPVTIRTTRTGRFILGFDLWCGSGVEGECYRRYVMEITEAEACELARQAADSASWVSDWVGYRRYEGRAAWRVSKAPVWMRRFAK